jgi:hypothetical protein
LPKFFDKCAEFFNLFKAHANQPKYRVVSFEQDETDNFRAIIQIVNTRQIFYMAPEEILSNDDMTDSFSQRDIRALTYLGYLGVNSPKYKILAKRLWSTSENDSKLVFAIKEKGNKKLIMKTAAEVFNDEEFIKNLDQKDAHILGYTAATEHSAQEKQILKNLTKSQNNKQDKE